SARLGPGPVSGRRTTRRRPDGSMGVTRERLTEADEGRRGGRRRTSTGAGPPWVRAPVDADVLRGRSAHVLAAVDVERLPGDETRLRSEEHTSELQSRENLVCRLLLEKKKRPTWKPCQARTP